MVAFAAIAGVAVPLARAQSLDPQSLYRIFLANGRALPSDGEGTVVGDRVVFVLPIGDPGATLERQLVSLPAAAVDIERTSRYAESLRKQRYAVMRGPTDYSALVADLNLVLAQMEEQSDPAPRLALAEEERGRLAEWPPAHFNYRLEDVRALMDHLDRVIDEIRRTSGAPDAAPRTALPAAPQDALTLPTPALRESIELALAAAAVDDDEAGRAAILRAVVSVAAAASLADLRDEASRRLEGELPRAARTGPVPTTPTPVRAPLAGPTSSAAGDPLPVEVRPAIRGGGVGPRAAALDDERQVPTTGASSGRRTAAPVSVWRRPSTRGAAGIFFLAAVGILWLARLARPRATRLPRPGGETGTIRWKAK